MQNLIIIGVGGFAREIYWHAQGSIGYGTDWDIKGFLDGDVKLAPEEYEKLEKPVLGDVNTYAINADDVFVCAIANPAVKKKLIEIMTARGARFINLIHKTAIIHGNVKMGVGNILTHHAYLHDHVRVGDFVTFNVYAGIGHDVEIGDYCSFMGGCGVNGYAHIGNGAYFGDGSVIMANGKVEDDAYVGIRSVVFKRVKKGQKVFGNPAMPISPPDHVDNPNGGGVFSAT